MDVKDDLAKWRKEDICAHWGDDYDRYEGAIVPPIFQNTLFTRKTKNHGYTYTRMSNPTLELAERKTAALECGECALAFSSGMAAITAAIMHVIEKDCHIVSLNSLYAPARTFIGSYLRKLGVKSTFVPGDCVEQFEEAIRPDTKLFYLESPVSNVFSMQDLSGIAQLARSKGIATIVDNTWATPLYQNPLQLGIDIVVHSASKYMGGHSDLIGGMLVASEESIQSIQVNERGMYGAIMDPHQAWLLTRGLRTLPLRMARHAENGLRIARFLKEHPHVEKVFYPGLEEHPQYELGQKQMSGYSGLMSFIPSEGATRDITAMARAMRVFEVGPSWGGFESLMNYPGAGMKPEATEATGIPPGLIRISVGLEHADSIMDDLDRGLHQWMKGSLR
ncbi:trans-sulfuration enzyme family protein [Paenibacillus sp. J5C2022]|uniref:trans-sulfuration enzyme family protein n=1 Tax=Paenibacillus sp. J5C2022 TaxID=2977129 RepID=UPI0021D26925|nr:aminotransferase class I/II-fold pyridoxal phosphate-dependent enzyme [Paenibacillus sp. J5C2022]